jgi:hypothetical protein
MGLVSSLMANSTAKFIAVHTLRGLALATGHSVPAATSKARNQQCVKLTKDHEEVVRMVSFWCNLRLNNLQQTGAAQKRITEITRSDAQFLNALNHAIAVQTEEDNVLDAWLFFDNDVRSTDYFELQYCARGTKVTKATFSLFAQC